MDALLTKSSPVKQKNKVRPIDDYAANVVNQPVCWELFDAYKQIPLSDQAYEIDDYLAVFCQGQSFSNLQTTSAAFRVHCPSRRFPENFFGQMGRKESSAEVVMVSIFRRFSESV